MIPYYNVLESSYFLCLRAIQKNFTIVFVAFFPFLFYAGVPEINWQMFIANTSFITQEPYDQAWACLLEHTGNYFDCNLFSANQDACDSQ